MKEEVSPIPACASNILDLVKNNIRVKGYVIYVVGSYKKLNRVYSHTSVLPMWCLVGCEIGKEQNKICIISQ